MCNGVQKNAAWEVFVLLQVRAVLDAGMIGGDRSKLNSNDSEGWETMCCVDDVVCMREFYKGFVGESLVLPEA